MYPFNRFWMSADSVSDTALGFEIYLKRKLKITPNPWPCGAYILVRNCNSHKPKLGNLNRPVRKKSFCSGWLIGWLVFGMTEQ